jgi:hypothetical protein
MNNINYFEKYQKYTKKYNELMGGVTCLFDKNLNSIVYHFTTETLTDTTNVQNPATDKNISYNKVPLIDSVSAVFGEAIKECNNKNILIVLDSFTLPKIAERVNSYLHGIELNNEHYLQNMTIINHTNDNTKVVYLIYDKNKKRILKKIANVFPRSGQLKTNDPQFFSNVQLNKTLPKRIDTSKKAVYTMTIQAGGEKKKIQMRWMNTISKSKNLKDQWWFSWYFNVPPCANVRLSQSSGTCWLNATLNSLFLVDQIINVIVGRYNELSDAEKENYKISLGNFDCSNCDLRTLLFSLVYNLLIKKIKAKPDDKNFVGYLASKVKCEYENKQNTQQCNIVQYGDGGDSFYGMEVIFEKILKQEDYLCISIRQQLNDNFNKFANSHNVLVNAYNDANSSLQNIINKYNSEIDSNKRDQIMLQYHEQQEKISKIGNTIDNFQLDMQKKEQELQENIQLLQQPNNFQLDNNDIFDDMGTPKIVVFRNNFLSLERHITFNGVKYQLYSGIISLKGMDHVVCGMICNNKAYIYDSNNILVQSDWDKGQFKKYLENPQTRELYRISNLGVKQLECAVYIRA